MIAAAPKKKKILFACLSNEYGGKQEMTLSSFQLLLHLFALFQYFLFSPDFLLPLHAQSTQDTLRSAAAPAAAHRAAPAGTGSEPQAVLGEPGM